ncbi:peptidase dimerization domain protein, partial [bacterium]|nr:peptidase dimerization domain protein [bacterium]
MTHITDYIQEHKDRFINELMDLLRIPSISADPAYSQDVHACAQAVRDHLIKAGADKVEICQTAGYPIVYGEKM